jgi:PAS domain S-box-containing protein
LSLSKPFTPSDYIVQEASYPFEDRASSTSKTIDSPQTHSSNSKSPTFLTNPSAPSSNTSISGDSASAYQLEVSAPAQNLVTLQQQSANPPPPNAPTPPLGLPVYSASGFDFLSILARVANRPHPSIVLGPVDLTCSFTVVDTRRWDRPIVYASPTFFKLTGYEEHEVIGRNCRFLQSPTGEIQPGEVRKFTSQDAVTHLRKGLQADKECQASLVNFKKGGKAFINLVTVVPIPGGVNNGPDEQDDYVYHVGFQVDLTEQPNAILQRLRDGSYIVNYSMGNGPGSVPALALRDRKMHGGHHGPRSKELQGLLADPNFLATIPITSEMANSNSSSSNNANADGSSNSGGKHSDAASTSHEGSQPLSLILLEKLPDFILVLSLKGAFLYVAPSVRAVLGYEPSELVGTLISDYCHAADVVPVMRELKDSSSSIPASSSTAADGGNSAPVGLHATPPRTVDILFRMRAKSGAYVWVECRGRLHIEPGKGRKAIILSARARGVPSFSWDYVALAGGLATSTQAQGQQQQQQQQKQTGCPETWLSVDAREGRVLSADRKAEDVLGYTDRELIGRQLGELAVDDMHRGHLAQAMRDVVEEYGTGAGPPPMPPPKTVACTLRDKQNREVSVQMVLYASPPSAAASPTPVPLVVQIRASDVAVSTAALPRSNGNNTGNNNNNNNDSSCNVFAEMDVNRSTSWIYELQQVKLENQRLAEEVERLEASSSSSTSASSLSPISSSPRTGFGPSQGSGAETPTGYGASMQDVQPTYVPSSVTAADQYAAGVPPHSPLDDVRSVAREWAEYEVAAQSRAMMPARLPLGQKRSWDDHHRA